MQTGERVKVLRLAMGYDRAAQFAARLGVSPQRWNNFEKGMPLSRDMAIKLVRTFPGLSLDWLYLATRDGLSMRMAHLLDEAERSGKAVNETTVRG